MEEVTRWFKQQEATLVRGIADNWAAVDPLESFEHCPHFLLLGLIISFVVTQKALAILLCSRIEVTRIVFAHYPHDISDEADEGFPHSDHNCVQDKTMLRCSLLADQAYSRLRNLSW